MFKDSDEYISDAEVKKSQYLTFTIDQDIYGLNIKFVKQIIAMQKIIDIPEQPPYIKGVINLRGQIIPVIDIRVKFKKELREYDSKTCIIIVEVNDLTVGIIVDRVFDVVSINEADIAEAPELNSQIQNRFIQGVMKTANKVYILLDCYELIKHDKRDVS